MVVETHVVVNLTVGPKEAESLIQRKEHQILFLNLGPATYKTQQVHLITGSSCSSKPKMTNHDLHIATRTTCHTLKNPASTPPPLPNRLPTIRENPLNPLKNGKSLQPRCLQARELRLEIRTIFGYRNLTYGFRKCTTHGYSAHLHLRPQQSSRPDEPCARCEML